VGYKVGKLAVRILNGEKPEDIPIVRSKKLDLVISLKNAENYGVTIPEKLKEKADKIL
jgi:putative ABC transport system substrate-binding protein